MTPIMKKVLAPIIFALFYSLLTACATNPVTGRQDIVLMSEHQEISIGKNMHVELVAKGSVYENKDLQKYVSAIGNKLEENSHRSNLNYTFTVVDSPDINAYALPGGYIYINRGLLAYLNNETQLAAVLAHEIGHVTARHSVRQQTASAASGILAAIAYVGTGSKDLADASNMTGTALVRGYGREHELEADRLGAEYLHKSGYDPDGLLDVITILKNQEQYNRLKAKQQGKSVQSYHGLFSTHPRNDRRLHEVISKAKSLGKSPVNNTDPAKYRSLVNGLAFGKAKPEAEQQDNRYYHNKLRFTFAYPDLWNVEATSKAINVRPKDNLASINLRIRRSDRNISPRDFLSKHAGIDRLFQSRSLSQYGLNGHTGVTPATQSQPAQRIAVIYYGSYAYVFTGSVSQHAKLDDYDMGFMEVIESFRGLKRSEYISSKPELAIHYIKADRASRFANLARGSKLGNDAETQLRLLNGYYPSGEPKPGEWIKIVK